MMQFCNLNYSLTTHINRTYLKTISRHRNREFAPIMSKLISMCCFELAQMAAFLDFTHNAKSKVRCRHTTMSGIYVPANVHQNHDVASILLKII